MDKDLHNIEDLFRSALEDNEESPSAKVWDTVDNSLDKDNVISIKKKYRMLKKLSLLLLLLLIALSIYELNNHRTAENLTEPNRAGTDKKTIPENKTDNPIATDENTIPSKGTFDSKDLNNVSQLNNIQDNPVAEEKIPTNNFQVRPGNNLITGRQNEKGINNNSLPDKKIFITLRQRPLFNDPANYPQKIKVPETNKNNLSLRTDYNFVPIDNSSYFPKRLYTQPQEKINQSVTSLIDSGRLTNQLALNKIIPAVDIKNNVPPQTKKKEVKLSRFFLSTFYSPDIVWYHLEEDLPGNQPETASEIKKSERHEFSSTTGLLFGYILNKHWSLQSGLTFSNTNITVEPKTIYAQSDNNGNIKYRVNISSGYGYILPSFQNAPVIGDSLKVTAATHKLRYVGIPVAIKYSAKKGKLNFETTAGVTVNFLTKGKLETEVQKGPNNEVDILNNIQGLKSTYISVLTGAGAEYKLTKKLLVTLMPTARFALTPINKGAVVKTFPNSFGLSADLRIRL